MKRTTIYGTSYQSARAARVKLFGNKCERCRRKGGEHRIEFHHWDAESYELDKRNEMKVADGVLLCVECHDLFTDFERRQRNQANAKVSLSRSQAPLIIRNTNGTEDQTNRNNPARAAQ